MTSQLNHNAEGNSSDATCITITDVCNRLNPQSKLYSLQLKTVCIVVWNSMSTNPGERK